MKKFLSLVFVVLVSNSSFAGGLAEWKSQQQASRGIMKHVGGGFGGGRYEGVGFSTSSADHAIRSCCYYGKRPIRDQSVVYGYNRQFKRWGWFATIIYD